MELSLHQCSSSFIHILVLLHDEFHKCNLLILELKNEVLNLPVLTGRVVQLHHVLLEGIAIYEPIALAERTIVASFWRLLPLLLHSLDRLLFAGKFARQFLQQFSLYFELILLNRQS